MSDPAPAAPPPPSLGLPAALVQHRGFTWSCAAVTTLLAGANLAGISLWKCPFRAVTGLPCPGCGMTRSCTCLLRGQFQQSLEFHAFGPLLLVVGLIGFTGSLLPTAPRERLIRFLQQWDRRLRFSPITLGALVIYSLTRWVSPG